jgi:DNA-binding XRE family transcriptional regulator
LGDKIARARRWLGITQEELARQIGVDPTTLARWETGKVRLLK